MPDHRFAHYHSGEQEGGTLFFGRQQELAKFREILGRRPGVRILSVYGTGGIGKSSLLHEFQQIGMQQSCKVIRVEGHDSLQTPDALGAQLAQLSGAVLRPHDSVVDVSISHLNKLSEEQLVVLLLDDYENMDSLDRWLREYLLPALDPRILTVIAGRYPLSEEWQLSPAWRGRLCRMPLEELSFRTFQELCRAHGIREERDMKGLWSQTKGYPLMIAIAVAAAAESKWSRAASPFIEGQSHDFLAYMVDRWLREVTDTRLRSMVEVVSALRYFNQDIVSHVLERELDTSEFRQLTKYSFVYRTNHGWRIHELLRNAVIQDLMARSPQTYDRYLTRIVTYYYNHIASGRRTSQTAWYAGELMYYIGGPIPRAFLHGAGAAPACFEKADPMDLESIRAYVHNRQQDPEDTMVQLYDPYTNRNFLLEQTARHSRQLFDQARLQEFGSFDPGCFRILRDSSGEMAGLAVIVPINDKTLGWLKRHPASADYFRGLAQPQLAAYAVPESTCSGWFIHTIDIADFGNTELHVAVAQLIISLVFSGERILAAPSTPYLQSAFESLLFERVCEPVEAAQKGVEPGPEGSPQPGERGGRAQTTTARDEQPPAMDRGDWPPMMMLDTRGDRLLAYIRSLMELVGVELLLPDELSARLDARPDGPQPARPPARATVPPPAEAPKPQAQAHPQAILTDGEKQVADLLLNGLTNAEIAKQLFLSEVTVKKRLSAMFQKFEVTNRTFLLRKLMNFFDEF